MTTKQSDLLWWEPYLQSSLKKGPLTIPLMPAPLQNIPLENDKAIVKILKHYKLTPSSDPKHNNLTIIDIGLPSESILFATQGYTVEAFEARTEGIKRVQNGYSQHPLHVQERIHLHHTALSNVSNTTLQIYDANDSSSLLESAVQSKKEKPKFEQYGQRMETVQVEQLDSFLTTPTTTVVVAIKIDTQGVEGEIFMGSQQLLSPSKQHPPPKVIVTEYCTRLRPYLELRVGIHLLDGLGYTCYLRPTAAFPQPLVLDETMDYCGDFVCLHS